MTRRKADKNTGVHRAGARRRCLVALFCAMATALAACGGLPTDATPRAGKPVLGQPRQGIEVFPEEPREEAGPEQIVRGFLLANVRFNDSHEVARAYLTDDLATEWVPTSNILIYTGDYDLTNPADGTVEATVNVQGVLDGEGRLTQASAGSSQNEQFGLTQVDGQWRIDAFPEDFGLWLSAPAFNAQYGTAAINYLSTDGTAFVPETRWFSRDDGLPTALARALLAPVPPYLEDAVVTGATEGANLVAGAVPVDPATGTATVNLQGAGITEDPERVRALYAQFFKTLSQAPGVRDVQLQINGQPLPAPGVSGPLTSLDEVGMAGEPEPTDYAVLRVGETLTPVDPLNYALRDVDPAQARALDLPDVSQKWIDLAMKPAANQFAGVDEARNTLWRRVGTQEVERTDIGTHLSAPSFDGLDSLWVSGDSASGPQVWAIDTREGVGAPATPMEADWLERGSTVEAFTVAPDGQRVALIIREGTTARLFLSGIIRDQQGRPTGLTAPRRIATTLESVTSVSWGSPEELAVLGRQAADDEDRPLLVLIGGWIEPLRPEADAQKIVAMPTTLGDKLAVVTGEGQVYTREGSGWFPYRNGDDLIVPTG